MLCNVEYSTFAIVELKEVEARKYRTDQKYTVYT